MSYLARIAECNSHDPSRYRPFMAAGRRIGWLRRPFLDRLGDFPEVFAIDDGAVTLNPGLDSFEARSEAFDTVLRALAAEGVISGWRSEKYPIPPSFTEPPLLRMERAAVTLFGAGSFGVHVNGYVRHGDGMKMWIARRARDKPSYPGELDNFVAGGQPMGIGLMENVIKEAAEEADVPPSIARAAVAVGAVSYCHEVPDGAHSGGLSPDVMFVYDMELPVDFTPRNTDGEIDEFYLMPVDEVMKITRETSDFKFNCALVNIDFFIRHGFLNAENDPDYLEILNGLRL